ncbi:L-aminopeptidase/D-esterase [Halobacteroides halobius DSM 5150]|uniref:L-aminopeptidase/D-esterase n=1 Tax=Halobacteroides halobius (strain ATCC 35273 / DSM 5150 / MD-1) TaxID=748449 RepID=L0KAX6_HALHC|nr:P1 family peptidase [Halobacteroides halobius]AGB42447.1 L-aminopeptidase/D-esterase [Halobacteroides halobius DSM 5150]
MKDYITDVPGIKVGHAHSKEGMTGCTVILTEKGATTGVDVRGSAPGTRELALLDPINTVDKAHAILLTGGSAFGLSAADGVMTTLENKKIGFNVGVTKVPIVPAAVLFDLEVGDYQIRPNATMGQQATKNASSTETRLGKVGAGMGCTVGKLLGIEQASPSGLGSASLQLTDEIYVGALVAVNAFGDILDKKGKIIAGCKDEQGDFINTYQAMKEEEIKGFGKNTTIGVVATNVQLTKTEANKVAQVAHNGYAKHIRPVHTMLDGDTIFALSTGDKRIDINLLATAASQVMGQAIVKAIDNV